MEYKDYYAILGVNRKASSDEIKQAYRRLARKYHPDVSKEANAEEQFKNVQEAYEVLKDQKKRNAYDQLGSNWRSGQEFKAPPDWDAYSQFSSQGFQEEDLSGFSDFFSQLFGGARGRGRQAHFYHEDFGGFTQRGQDQQAAIDITLEEAFRSVTKTIQLQIPEMDAVSQRIQYKLKTIKVNVPAGAAQGQKLRLSGQGQASLSGGPSGDLYLQINIKAHPLFSLQGQDVYLTLPITPWEAALGADITIPTLGGPVGLKLAPNSQAGQKLRLKGRGMPGKTATGDQFAILQILTPPAKNDEQRAFYKKMAQVLPFNPRDQWPS